MTLARRLLTVDCAAVVKANAYGMGLEPVTTKLANAGCKTFFVADLTEARRVRARAREAAIYVLNGFSPEATAAFIEISARPVINSMTELAEWDAFVAAHKWRGGAALHVDTGMNRLGISAEEAIALAPRVQTENHGITLLMSHLACAETPRSPAQCQTGCAVSRRSVRYIAASPLRSPIPPAFSLATQRIAIWRDRARPSTASIPPRAIPIRCKALSN